MQKIQKQWHNKNPGYGKTWRRKNIDKVIEQERIRNKIWIKNNPERYKEIRLKASIKYLKTKNGQLRKLCQATSQRLSLSKICYSRFDLLDYTPEQFINHLLEPYPNFMSLGSAAKVGYHQDHIIPLFYISKNVDNKIIAFKIAMDLNNLRLIPAKENLKKQHKLIPEAIELIPILWKKYGADDPEILLDLIDLEDE